MKRSQSQRRLMPAPVKLESGCKVGWYYYKTRAAADKAAKVAKHNAEIAMENGYDFGYCSPGEVQAVGDGLYRVCVP